MKFYRFDDKRPILIPADSSAGGGDLTHEAESAHCVQLRSVIFT